MLGRLPAPLTATGRRLFAGSRAWVAFSGLVLVWFLSAPERTPFNRHLGVVLVTVLSLAAARAMEQAGGREDLPVEFRKGLRWIALSLVMIGVGGMLVSLIRVVDPKSTGPFNLADLFFLGTYPVILVGLLKMPRAERSGIGVGRIVIDTAVFVAGVGLPLWFFCVGPGIATASGLETLPVVAYPLVTFTGIATLNIIVLTRTALPSRGAFRMLVIAISSSWLADLLYLLDSVQGFLFSGRWPINWVNVCNTVSLGLFVAAALRIRSEKTAGPRMARPAASSPLPMATMVVVSAWLLVFLLKGHPTPEAMSRITWSLASLFVFLAVRETFVYRDGARWMSAEIERESRTRFEALVRHSSDVIMVVDAGRTVRFASPAVAVALGMSADAVAGVPLLSLVHADDAARGAEFLDRLLATQKGLQSVQWRLRHADGSFRYFETVGSNGVEASDLEGLVLNSRDVSDRIALEEKLRKAQKLEALGQLVGGIAHNFNNILTSTMMRLGFLRRNRELPAGVIKEIDALDKEAKRSAELTRKLVLFGQQQFMRKAPVDVRESVARLRPEIVGLLGSAVQLYVTGGSSPAWVMADSGLVDQVILSVCANARDAMTAGGCLIIEVNAMDAAQVPSSPEDGGRPESVVRISFQDTGRGMDESVRSRLFEPFFTTKGPSGGVGLGLAAVHGIVKQHQGWMDVESAPGLGSTFRIYLPREAAAAPS